MNGDFTTSRDEFALLDQLETRHVRLPQALHELLHDGLRPATIGLAGLLGTLVVYYGLFAAPFMRVPLMSVAAGSSAALLVIWSALRTRQVPSQPGTPGCRGGGRHPRVEHSAPLGAQSRPARTRL